MPKIVQRVENTLYWHWSIWKSLEQWLNVARDEFALLERVNNNNRTPRFWDIVRAQSPKMKKAKQWLLENGRRLEEEI